MQPSFYFGVLLKGVSGAYKGLRRCVFVYVGLCHSKLIALLIIY